MQAFISQLLVVLKTDRFEARTIFKLVEYFRVVDGTEVVLEENENLEEESNTKTNKIIKVFPKSADILITTDRYRKG